MVASGDYLICVLQGSVIRMCLVLLGADGCSSCSVVVGTGVRSTGIAAHRLPRAVTVDATVDGVFPDTRNIRARLRGIRLLPCHSSTHGLAPGVRLADEGKYLLADADSDRTQRECLESGAACTMGTGVVSGCRRQTCFIRL